MIVVVLVVDRVLLLAKQFGVMCAMIPAPVGYNPAVADEEKVIDEAVAASINVGNQ